MNKLQRAGIALVFYATFWLQTLPQEVAGATVSAVSNYVKAGVALVGLGLFILGKDD